MSIDSLINLCGVSHFEIDIQSEIFIKDLMKQVQKAAQHINIPANWFAQLPYCIDWSTGFGWKRLQIDHSRMKTMKIGNKKALRLCVRMSASTLVQVKGSSLPLLFRR